MSSASALDVEELENVPLVRMADVQPDRSVEYAADSSQKSQIKGPCEQSYEYCMMDNSDEESNIGSMVSIKSEEVDCDDDAEIIVSDVVESVVKDGPLPPSPEPPKNHKPSPKSWPTLEILPGGVINLADKSEPCLEPLIEDENATDYNGMMYACAKCSQSYKHLPCLVKHLRWHERGESEFTMKKYVPKIVSLQKSPKVDRGRNLQLLCKRTYARKPKVKKEPKES